MPCISELILWIVLIKFVESSIWSLVYMQLNYTWLLQYYIFTIANGWKKPTLWLHICIRTVVYSICTCAHFIYLSIFVRSRAHMHIGTHTYAHTYAHTHAHIHTHTQRYVSYALAYKRTLLLTHIIHIHIHSKHTFHILISFLFLTFYML